MIRSILASLTGLGTDASVLETAVAIATRHQASVEALHVRLSEKDILAISAFTRPWDVALADRKQLQEARRAFDDACARHPDLVNAPARLTWHDLIGDGFYSTLNRGRLNDLVVVAHDTDTTRGRAGNLVMQIGRPVVLAPPRPPEQVGTAIAIAWKDSAESARALTAAMPLIEKAERLVLLAVHEDTGSEDTVEAGIQELKANLGRIGIPIEVSMPAATFDTAASAARAAAYEANCDLLVMGAYGHSRAHEYIFGGFTREMLLDSALPVLMCH